MKILTILGTRPELIRLSLIIKKLDKLCDHVLVHTGQNFDPKLSDIFFDELDIRASNYHLGIRAVDYGAQVGEILKHSELLIRKENPDRILILGDTNSGLSAIVAKRMGVPVFHMEAGNRCYDDKVPEEVNRKIIDHSSFVLLPYTNSSKENLLREGIAANRIYVTGNPIYEVLENYHQNIISSKILKSLNIKSQKFFLVTLHRAENVDNKLRLAKLIKVLDKLAEIYNLPIILSLHPRTVARLKKFKLGFENKLIRLMEPFGFFDFVMLEKNALCVLSDSGTVQEECSIFKVPTVTLRDVTERPETIDAGSNLISGIDVVTVLNAVKTVLFCQFDWPIPIEYAKKNVSDTVVKLLMSYWPTTP